jgi:Holliday junction resolvase RusA-like endonuclease
MTLMVMGTPVPKGSARAFVIPGRGDNKVRAVVVQNNKKALSHWQTQIGNEARYAMSHAQVPPPFDGPFMVGVTFMFNRPKSVSVKARPVPAVKPDLDKLIRAVLDGLTGILWRDDAQVVSIIAKKRYLIAAGAEYVEIRISEWADAY